MEDDVVLSLWFLINNNNNFSMQSVDESYEYVSLEHDVNGSTATDRKSAPEQSDQCEVPESTEPVTENGTNGTVEVGGVFHEYPPRPVRVLAEENGIHIFEDGHFYTEVQFFLSFVFYNSPAMHIHAYIYMYSSYL